MSTVTKERIAVLQAALAALPEGVDPYKLYAYAIATDARPQAEEFAQDEGECMSPVDMLMVQMEAEMDGTDSVGDLYGTALDYLRAMDPDADKPVEVQP